MMLWMRTLICCIAIGATACSDSIAQNDVPLELETPWDTLRVRAELPTAILDSLHETQVYFG